MTLLVGFGVLVLLVEIGWAVQIHRVSRFRHRLIDRVSEVNLADVGRYWDSLRAAVDSGMAVDAFWTALKGPDVSWRWRLFETIPRSRMIRQFWKPLDSFVPPDLLKPATYSFDGAHSGAPITAEAFAKMDAPIAS